MGFYLEFKFPPKALIFLWKLHNGILPTKIFLFNRIGQRFNQTNCSLCNNYENTYIHIFWLCEVAKKVWFKLIAWWGLIGRVFIKDLYSLWKSCSLFLFTICRQVWQNTLVACLLTLWLERNNMIFAGTKLVMMASLL